MPAFLLWGTHDRAVSLESGRQLKAILNCGEIQILPGVGHLPHDEAPVAFADAVNGFLRKLDRSEAHRGPQLVRSEA